MHRSVALAGSRGDAIVFDYRVVHRGLGNTGDARRPVLYLTSSRSWFRDAQNFPDERLIAGKSPGGSGGGSGGSGGSGGFGGAKPKPKPKPGGKKGGKKRK